MLAVHVAVILNELNADTRLLTGVQENVRNWKK